MREENSVHNLFKKKKIHLVAGAKCFSSRSRFCIDSDNSMKMLD